MSSNTELKEIIADQEQEIADLRAEVLQLNTANVQADEEIKSLKQTLRENKVHNNGSHRED